MYLFISRWLSDKCKFLVLTFYFLWYFFDAYFVCNSHYRNNNKCGFYLGTTFTFGPHFKKVENRVFIKRHPIFSYGYKASANPSFAVEQMDAFLRHCQEKAQRNLSSLPVPKRQQANPKNIFLVCNQQRTLITPQPPHPPYKHIHHPPKNIIFV